MEQLLPCLNLKQNKENKQSYGHAFPRAPEPNNRAMNETGVSLTKLGSSGHLAWPHPHVGPPQWDSENAEALSRGLLVDVALQNNGVDAGKTAKHPRRFDVASPAIKIGRREISRSHNMILCGGIRLIS